ncbi:MAG: ribosome biogenesis GTPase YlqF, partial [Snowella sp.]|nr:ribosome biogenesis GTPase YlqF [Snowella sp.]
ISDSLELLDSPGVIPLKLDNQDNALKLAICEDIGEAAYENQAVAIALIDLLFDLALGQSLTNRYQVPPQQMNGDLYLIALANERYNGDRERAAVQLLNDFRKGLLGPLPLELPPAIAMPTVEFNSVDS